MKPWWTLAILLLGAGGANGQQKSPAIDKSPMDISYCPANYPILKIQNKLTEPLIARVIYSRPQKNGRPIFGELVEYEKVWRLGANEATEIEFFRDVRIGSAKVRKGRYTLYAIPSPDKWTLIINKENDTWGAFQYDVKKDLLRVELKTEKNPETVESFSLYFDGGKGNALLTFAWDDVMAKLPISW
jgi:hypothetical protein